MLLDASNTTHLQLDLKKWRALDQAHFHARLGAFVLNNVVKVSAEAVVYVDTVIDDIDGEMRE